MVFIICNERNRYSFCRLAERIFSDLDNIVVKIRFGRRWITIETVPIDIIMVKIPFLPRDDLEHALTTIHELIKTIKTRKEKLYNHETR